MEQVEEDRNMPETRKQIKPHATPRFHKPKPKLKKSPNRHIAGAPSPQAPAWSFSRHPLSNPIISR